MRARTVVVLSICIGMACVGCKKDAEINTAMTDLSAFTAELVQKVEATQGSMAGLEAAQQFLDSRKEEIKKKLGILKEARGFQVSDATKRTMTDSVTRNMTSVASLQIKYVTRSLNDANYKSKLEKLVKDYTTLLTS
jgi:outer membrane murein-binding lipoprotein Lpp